MFTPLTRLLFLVICVLIASVAASEGWTIVLILVSLLSLVILWGYKNVGTVYLALNKIRKQQYSEGERIMSMMKKPEKLTKSRKAYYHYIMAFIAREKDNFDEAYRLFTLALAEGIKAEGDRVAALLALADIALIKGRKAEAREYMKAVNGLKVRENILPQVKQMQAYLA